MKPRLAARTASRTCVGATGGSVKSANVSASIGPNAWQTIAFMSPLRLAPRRAAGADRRSIPP